VLVFECAVLPLRTVGLQEILLILAILALLFGGAKLGLLGRELGPWFGPRVRVLKWIMARLFLDEAAQIRAEEAVGEDLSRAINKTLSIQSEGPAADLLRTLGDRLAMAVEGPKRRFCFRVVSGSEFNAFAVPGGHVYVYTALADHCDEDEVAFVLGHEIGHVVLKHAADRLLATGLWGCLWALITRGGTPAALMTRLFENLLEKDYSREQEFEADGYGSNLLRRAGFVEGSAVRFLHKLSLLSGPERNRFRYLSSHPPVSDRIAKLDVGFSGTAP